MQAYYIVVNKKYTACDNRNYEKLANIRNGTISKRLLNFIST